MLKLSCMHKHAAAMLMHTTLTQPPQSEVFSWQPSILITQELMHVSCVFMTYLWFSCTLVQVCWSACTHLVYSPCSLVAVSRAQIHSRLGELLWIRGEWSKVFLALYLWHVIILWFWPDCALCHHKCIRHYVGILWVNCSQHEIFVSMQLLQWC